MCDNQNLKADRIRCEACRTINLAKNAGQSKPNMQVYEKCTPMPKFDCGRVTGLNSHYHKHKKKLWLQVLPGALASYTSDPRTFLPFGMILTPILRDMAARLADVPVKAKLPLNPTCIRVCPRHEVLMRMRGELPPKVCPIPYGHGKLMFGVKAALLAGSLYFTYTQGVWGDQRDVTEAIARWQEYIRSMYTRRPPIFDKCGKVIRKENPESVIAPAYNIYKSFVTLCFSGIVKLPLIVKCWYLEYLKEIQKKKLDEIKERKLRKAGVQ